jgi:predicted nucleic acid-binding protein
MVQKMIAVIVDTNIYFSAFYNPRGKEAEILKRANRGEVLLLSPDSVREELERNLRFKLGLTDSEVLAIISSLPTIWVPRVEYEGELRGAEALLRHEEDAPILACALKFEAGILTGNVKHFDTSRLKSKVIVWSSTRLLQALK